MFEGMTTEEKIAYCERAIENISNKLVKRIAQGYRTSSEGRAERVIEWYKKTIKEFRKEQSDE